jgi:hypothetical protein
MSEAQASYGETSEKKFAVKEFRLGVLFVHGIGTQPPRDTLVRWGDVLLKVIGRATEEEPGRTIPTVTRADAGDRSGDKPAEVAVEFRRNNEDQREKWLLAEGWWADSFPAPTYSELVSWSFRAVPWSIALHVAQRYWQTNPTASKGEWLWAGVKAVTQLLGYLALTPVFMMIPALTLVLGLLPIPQLRSLILTTQTMLIGSVGDSLAFVESPLRAALIRGRVLEGLERLTNRCERTVIVAHSRGAAATLDALGGILANDESESLSTSAPTVVPDALVTFGSGVNQLVSLRVLLAGRLEQKTGNNPAFAAVTSTLGMIVLMVFIFVSIRSESASIPQLMKAFIFLTVFWGSGWLINWAASKLPAAEKIQKRAALFIIAAVGALVYYFSKDLISPLWDIRTGNVMFLTLVVLNLVFSIKTILSLDTRAAVTKPVQHPPGLLRWMDLYSSADPVPNGPTTIEGTSAEVTSVRVWNRGSMLSDHVTYWKNLDGFVLRVARMCAETAESPWLNKLPPPTLSDWLDRRAAWRVRLLRLTVWGNRAFWAFVLYLLWTRYGASVPLPFSFPVWFWDWGPAVARFGTVTALVALAAWVAAAALRCRWSAWVRADQDALLARNTARVVKWPHDPLSGLGTVISVLGAFGFALALRLEALAGTILSDPLFWVSAPIQIMIIWGWGGLISWIITWVWQGPLRPSVESENIDSPASHPRISSQS